MKNDGDSGPSFGVGAASLVASARHHDAQADALWCYASDCERWGLAADAIEARSQTLAMRVRALIDRALYAGLNAAEGQSG
jgi:hypothetical protein